MMKRIGVTIASLAIAMVIAKLLIGATTITGVSCSRSAFYDASSAGATQLVPSTTSTLPATTGTIYVCGYTIATTTATNVSLVYGTGTNCATGTTKITPAWQFLTTTAALGGIADGAQQFRGLSIPTGQNLCINSSNAVAVQAIVYYDQF